MKLSRLANLADRLLGMVAPEISAEACGYKYTGRQTAGPCASGFCEVYCIPAGKDCAGPPWTSTCECVCG
jgi:hypothetical protein